MANTGTFRFILPNGTSRDLPATGTVDSAIRSQGFNPTDMTVRHNNAIITSFDAPITPGSVVTLAPKKMDSAR